MGVGDADANPLDGDSDDTEEDDLGGGVAVAGRLPEAALIRDGEVRTDVEKAGFSRPLRNWRY